MASSGPRPAQVSASRPRRLLILAEGHSADPHFGKTARGVLRYRREQVVAMLDSERAGANEDGVPIVGTVGDALRFEPTTALVGVATQGGRFPRAWRDLLKTSIASGLDVENGLHEFISDDPELSELADRHGVQLRDLRRPPAGLNVPTGKNLTHPAKVVLTVGSDCAIGKMTVSLELDAEARRRGVASEFVPTGQTGMAIAGWGIAVDAVVADFIAGAAEQLVVEGVARGGALLWVEGQGSLLHPAYSGVTLGLVHGSAPHAFVLCHQVDQRDVDGDPRFPIPPLRELVALHERLALIPRPARVAAIALNTRGLDDDAARVAIAAVEAETGLAADDPVRFGAERLTQIVLESVAETG
jgi:D-glutamate N-acetyltransferase